MPSAKADRAAADAADFFGEGLAALAFDPAPTGGTGFAAPGNFNVFGAGLGEAFEIRFPVCLVFASLLDLPAAGLPVFEGAVFAALVA